MLDLGSLPTSAMMRLAKASPRRDGGSISWDIDIAMEVPDAEAAQLVDGYVPGALRAYSGGMEGARGKASTTGGFDLCAVELLREDGTHLARGHAEVRTATVSVTAQQAMLVVRLRLHGLLERAATDVVYKLDDVVQVRLAAQGAPRLSVADAVGVPPATRSGLVGRLVVAQVDDETTVAGIVVTQAAESLEVRELGGGAPVWVWLPASGRPDTVLDVVAPANEPDLQALEQDYREQCSEAGVAASWHDVITAIGVLYARQVVQARPDFAWELVPEVWAEALETATLNASGE